MIAAVALLAGSPFLQQEAAVSMEQVLEPGMLVPRRSLDSLVTHRYLFEAKDGDRIEGLATQYGVDIQLRLYGPEREGFIDYDFSVGRHEPFRRHAWRDGTYLLEVTTEDWDGGEYDLYFGLCAEEAADLPTRAAQYMAHYPPHYPGFALAVIEGEEVVYLGARGERTQEDGRPMGTDTPFHLQDLSLALYAQAFLALVEQGKLSWDDALRDHLPWLAEYEEPWMVRDLILMEYSLPDLRRIAEWVDGRPLQDGFLPADRARDLLSRRLLRVNPEWGRGDPGYTGEFLIQELLVASSGMPLEELMESLVLAPMGLTESGVARLKDYPLAGDGSIRRKERGTGSWEGHHWYPPGFPYLYSTMNDLSRWFAAMHGTPQHAATWAFLRDARIIEETGTLDTLEYSILSDRHLVTLEHSLLGNGLSGLSSVRARSALLDTWEMEHPGREQWLKMGASSTKDRPKERELEAYCGVFHCEQAEVTYTIQRKDDRLWLEAGNGDWIALDLHVSGDSLVPADRETISWVMPLDEARPRHSHLRFNLPRGGWVTFRRVED